jgi:hypothetical protein
MFPEYKEAWKAFYGDLLILDEFLYMICYVTGLNSDSVDTGLLTRIRLEFQDIRGDLLEATLREALYRRGSPLQSYEPPGEGLDESPYRLEMEKWVHCVVFDRAPQFFRLQQDKNTHESTFGARGEFESDPELDTASVTTTTILASTILWNSTLDPLHFIPLTGRGGGGKESSRRRRRRPPTRTSWFLEVPLRTTLFSATSLLPVQTVKRRCPGGGRRRNLNKVHGLSTVGSLFCSKGFRNT